MLCIVGGGPACISLLCCFIRTGIFDTIKDSIVVLEASNNFGSGALKKYHIRSNSSLKSIVDVLPDIVFETLSDKTKRLIECIGNDVCYLPIVADILEEAGEFFKRRIDIRLNTRVVQIFKNRVDTRLYSIESDKIICTNGGFQTSANISSMSYLTGRKIARNRDVLIVGGSHSAWSVAWKLIKNKHCGKIIIYSRHAPRIFCQNDEEARTIGFNDYDDMDKCPVTKQIFRFAGLRGDAKQIWYNRSIYNIEVVDKMPVGDFIRIDAYGYKPNSIKGIEHAIRFGFMSNAYEPSGETSFTKSKDGIWIYGNTMGELFVKKHFNRYIR